MQYFVIEEDKIKKAEERYLCGYAPNSCGKQTGEENKYCGSFKYCKYKRENEQY